MSPYAGGVTGVSLQLTSGSGFAHGGHTGAHTFKQLNLAIFNTGRTGFAQLGTDTILFLRLWEVGLALAERDVHLCVVPGPRLPPGFALPEGYRYVWWGAQTLSWATVGILMLPELENSVKILLEDGEKRVMWLGVETGLPGLEMIGILICAIYGPPGGDGVFWAAVVHNYQQLTAKY